MKLSQEEVQTAVDTTKEVLQTVDQQNQGLLIPVLQQVQNRLGYVPPVAMTVVAEHFSIPAVDVFGVITFYNQFRLTPPGKRQVKICMGTACHMRGAHIIQDSWERRLEIKVGETTDDREYSLERVACVGCCTLAPVVLINEETHGKITPTRVDGLIFAHQLERDKAQEQAQVQAQKGGAGNE